MRQAQTTGQQPSELGRRMLHLATYNLPQLNEHNEQLNEQTEQLHEQIENREINELTGDVIRVKFKLFAFFTLHASRFRAVLPEDVYD